ncbi:MAG: histone family protein [Candidatus Methanofastidiosia archaeon]|jgi:histone H3/H4
MELPHASVDKLIRKAGAYRVSKDAADELALYLEELGTKVAEEAITFSEHAGRKTVKAEDVELAKNRFSEI